MKPSHELTLLYQEAPATEKFAKNGTTKNVNLVVKKVPFTIIIGSKGSTVDFNVSHIAAMLIYDHPDRKEVDFVKTAPIEYETDIAKDGKKVTILMKILVLSSQLEGSFFLLKFHAKDSFNPAAPSLSVMSEPIRVVSKPSQLKVKEKRKRQPRNTQSKVFEEMLSRMEKTQREQQKLLESVIQSQQNQSLLIQSALLGAHSFAAPTETSTGIDPLSISSLEKTLETPLPPSPPTFEESFQTFLESYIATPASERPEKIRRVITASAAKKTEELAECVDLFWSEGLKKEVGFKELHSTASFTASGTPPASPYTEDGR
eukprot:TRINITY_DN6095_c0_g1_i1.p1 TRINITY_DN6095_c0_g1~~TRINITY_DN6095_c0_g1_i1.p1  ORF type:complete len:317 (-),score=17.24 TRINITY_DN6095_c0_g1_i1:212-1162(-)